MSRTETSNLGTIEMLDDAHWGAQTQRSLENFAIGDQRMSPAAIHALALIKKAAARVNDHLGELPPEVVRLIEQIADEVLVGRHGEHFPLVARQAGSGTQTNMSVNEAIVGRANELTGNPRGDKSPVHPNGYINRAQSPNDSSPIVMHVAAARAVHEQLPSAIAELSGGLVEQSARHTSLVKTGRTHLMDVMPITFGQKLPALVAQLDYAERVIRATLSAVYRLTQGGIVVGTGLNTPKGFTDAIVAETTAEPGLPFVATPSKFTALAGHEPLATLSGTLKSLAVTLMEIVNDLRLLGSGPCAGFAEVKLPANEPGGSIMPGKVNPIQCEALSVLACRAMGNNSTISFVTSQGHLQLNVFKPVIIYNLPESIRLFVDGCRNLNEHCTAGLKPDVQCTANLPEHGLMLVTALNSHIGRDKAAEIVKKTYTEGTTLRAVTLQLGYLDEAQFDE